MLGTSFQNSPGKKRHESDCRFTFAELRFPGSMHTQGVVRAPGCRRSGRRTRRGMDPETTGRIQPDHPGPAAKGTDLDRARSKEGPPKLMVGHKGKKRTPASKGSFPSRRCPLPPQNTSGSYTSSIEPRQVPPVLGAVQICTRSSNKHAPGLFGSVTT